MVKVIHGISLQKTRCTRFLSPSIFDDRFWRNSGGLRYFGFRYANFARNGKRIQWDFALDGRVINGYQLVAYPDYLLRFLDNHYLQFQVCGFGEHTISKHNLYGPKQNQEFLEMFEKLHLPGIIIAGDYLLDYYTDDSNIELRFILNNVPVIRLKEINTLNILLAYYFAFCYSSDNKYTFQEFFRQLKNNNSSPTMINAAFNLQGSVDKITSDQITRMLVAFGFIQNGVYTPNSRFQLFFELFDNPRFQPQCLY